MQVGAPACDGSDILQRQLAGARSATIPFVEQQLQGSSSAVTAATGYACAALREFFGVDAKLIAEAAIHKKSS